MKIVHVDYYHSRIPWYKKEIKKGKPDFANLYRYRRGWRKTGCNGGGTVTPCPRGGHTECILVTEDELLGQQSWIGVALCSMSDNFAYAVGRKLSFRRALAVMQYRYYEQKS